MLAAVAVAGGLWMASAPSAAAADGAYVLSDVQCDLSHDGVVDLTLVNDRGQASATFEVAGQAYVVAPLSARAVTYDGLADGPFSVPVSVDGQDASVAVTISCDGVQTAVLPKVGQVASSALPTTGASTGQTAAIAGGLVLAGFGISLSARRRVA